MFFALSKLLWIVVNPGNLLLIVLLACAVLSFTRWRGMALNLFRITAVVALFVAVVPVGSILKRNLENRFPEVSDLPDSVAGIVILGGVIDPAASAERGTTQINDAVERIIEGAALAKRYPGAKVVFSGGSGNLFDQSAREAPYAASVFTQFGLAPGRVIYEDRARNTAENARYAKQLAQPQPGEDWILVTSAFHMPRSVGVFRAAGWPVIPYPVDFSTAKAVTPSLGFNLNAGLGSFAGALREFIGLGAYRLKGYTDAWYPAPQSKGSVN